ncbi:signal peptidase I [Deinococcus maricopensis]|uniref:Signal peptidase I n=1 Tax=Deinococcus maricopensis (strain DSM 21211 / LMG 22137 / NRRL B-23946 / LB-34) TaxID=709986 RepID=E8U7P6_DEIML|nr:signal peptidase I [Deinococcus maricopensis]ADV67085.1 signal peptidase I [Deinococcus maricopensis DSM 21211]
MPHPAHSPPARSTLRRVWREWVLGAILPVWLVTTFLFTFARVDGASMQPTLHTGEVLLLLKYPRWARAWHLSGAFPRRGDIIVFKGPADSPYSTEPGPFGRPHRPYLVKRVVGLPGDTVDVEDGTVHVNGHALREPYASGPTEQDHAPVRVPAGHVYVLGDNRIIGESVDSRLFGPVDLRDVAGPVPLRLWPPARLTTR